MPSTNVIKNQEEILKKQQEVSESQSLFNLITFLRGYISI